MALADAFECEINELPVSIVLSWFEQKAVAILLRSIQPWNSRYSHWTKATRIYFRRCNASLQETFNLKLIGAAQEDMKEMLQINK